MISDLFFTIGFISVCLLLVGTILDSIKEPIK